MNNIPSPCLISPCFVLEEERLLDNLAKIETVIRETEITFLLALKGFAMYSVFDLLKDSLAGVAASSLNEVRLGREEFGKIVHTYAPAFNENEWEEVSRLSTGVTFNSLSQFFKYKEKGIPKELNVGIRINPEYSEVTTALYNPCVPESRLGVLARELPEKLPEEITGLHFHTLCENNSFVLERTLQAVEEKFGNYLAQVKWLNFGGGHLITDSNYDIEHLISLLKGFKQKYPHLELILEPGAAIAWQTGVLVSTVLDIIERGEVKIAMLDTSFSAHMPDTIEMPYQPKVRETSESGITYKLGGLTCLAGDFLGDYTFSEALKIGDQITFEDMMHYTMVKTNTFNGVNLPAIAIQRKNGELEIVKQFGYEDYKSRL